jgi:1-acyl-sn-glycerol-3-phosphate acyltransferase
VAHYNVRVIPARLFLRRSFRLGRLALHLLKGVTIAGLVLPIVSHARRDHLICNWSGQLLKVLGVRLKAGPVPTHHGGALLVCNHVSWLDVYLIHAARRVYFVSKSEVRAWPVAGWLAHKSGTLFLERGRRADTARINHAMRELMQSGAWVAVFPEGTTGDGRELKRFLPSLLQPAVDLGCPIIPAALRYRTLAGDYSAAPAYIDDISMLQSLCRIISEPGIIAELCFGEPFMPDGHRRELAVRAESTVTQLLGASPTRDTQPTAGLDAAAGGTLVKITADPPAAPQSIARPTDSPYPAQADRGE